MTTTTDRGTVPVYILPLGTKFAVLWIDQRTGPVIVRGQGDDGQVAAFVVENGGVPEPEWTEVSQGSIEALPADLRKAIGDALEALLAEVDKRSAGTTEVAR